MLAGMSIYKDFVLGNGIIDGAKYKSLWAILDAEGQVVVTAPCVLSTDKTSWELRIPTTDTINLLGKYTLMVMESDLVDSYQAVLCNERIEFVNVLY